MKYLSTPLLTSVVMGISNNIYEKEDGTFWYSPDDYIENGIMNCKMVSVFTDTIVNNKTLRHEQNIITSKELATDLYLIEREVPSKKHIERIQNNINYYEPVFIKRI